MATNDELSSIAILALKHDEHWTLRTADYESSPITVAVEHVTFCRKLRRSNDVARHVTRNATRHATRHAARYAARYAARNAAWNAARYATGHGP